MPATAKAKRVMHSWTSELESDLTKVVKSAPTMRSGFNEFASRHGMSAGAVQQHWYIMKKRNRVGRPKLTTVASNPVSHITSTTDFDSKPIAELIELQYQINEAIKRKVLVFARQLV